MLEVIIEIAGIQVILFGLYQLFLRKESDYRWRRAFLLGIVVVSVLIPFVELPAPEMVQKVNSSVLFSQEYVLSGAAVTANQAKNTDWLSILSSVSLLGSSIFLLVLLFSIWKIFRLYLTSTPLSVGSLWIWLHPRVEASFSFFNWIFSKDIVPAVIAHEAAHVKLKHSYDILLLQLNRTVFWWNPISWWMLQEMTEIHEFQADRLAIKDKNIDEYQELLINTTLSSMGWGLASSFHSGSLLKRLHAMKQNTKKINRWKISSLGALVAMIALVFACEELDQDIKKISEESRQIAFEELPEDMQEIWFEGEEKFSFVKVYINEGTLEDVKEMLTEIESIDPELIESYKVRYPLEANPEVIVVLRKGNKSYDYVEEKSKASDDVFTLVDQQPEFLGGMDSYYRYIAQNLTYPEAARRMGIQGRVFVQFIVNEDGYISDAETVKGIGGGCDEVAEKIIAASPRFAPGMHQGKPVKVRMVLPVFFSLEDRASKDAVEVDVQVTESPAYGEAHFVNEAAHIDQPNDTNSFVFEDPAEIGATEAERTAKAGALLAEAAASLSEVAVVGYAGKPYEVTNEPVPSPALPEYRGGVKALYDFIGEQLVYPEKAKKKSLEGRVFVQFVVKKDGTVDEVKVLKGIGAGCDEEAARVVALLDQWQPNLVDGQPVETRMILPIKFALN